MTALLTDNLPLLAVAPNGIKKLRELILELAVRGKLVPQDRNDEPAGALLKRVAEEKLRLVAEGKIKKQKTLEEIATEESPFVLPAGWEWTRLGNVSAYIQRGKGPAYVDQSDFRVVSQKCVRWTGLDLQPARFIEPESLVKYEPIRFLRSGDILWNSTGTGTIGRACIVENCSEDEQLVADSHVTVVRPTTISPVFLWRWIQSPSVQRELEGKASGTTNQIELNTSTVISHLTPIPPLAEQHRIVAKVDELMALCDRLEAQQADAESAHAQLVQALLDSLTQAADAEDFAASWQRVAEHFHTLFTTESSIDALKQTLLQLAVMGKLVPQDSSDEPASELLKRIAEEKARLVAEGKIKKQKLLAEIAEEDKTFALPIGWEWARLDDVAHVFAGNAFKSEDFQENPGVRVIKITNAGAGEFIETEDYLPSGYEVEYSPFSVKKSDLILALTRPYISTGLKVSKCPPEYDGALLNQRVAAIRFFSDINSDFGFLFFSSPIVLSIYQERFGGSGLQPNLKMSDVTTLLVPIPPAEEQHRIVAKVDQLMALCDQLKTRLTQARQLNEQLATALVEQAVA